MFLFIKKYSFFLYSGLKLFYFIRQLFNSSFIFFFDYFHVSVYLIFNKAYIFGLDPLQILIILLFDLIHFKTPGLIVLFYPILILKLRSTITLFLFLHFYVKLGLVFGMVLLQFSKLEGLIIELYFKSM